MTAAALAWRAAPRSERRWAGVIINEHLLTATQTRAHVEALAGTFDFIGHDDLPRRLERPGRRPFCLFTFDDGKLQNHSETAPELERLGVPAVFYLVSDFVGGDQALWHDDHEALVAAIGPVPAALDGELLKQLPHAVRIDRLQSALHAAGASADVADPRVALISWDDARDLAARGFVIGAHGRRHSILPRETQDDARDEIAQSLAAIGAQLGSPCTTFAFPNGNYNSALAHHAMRHGAQTVMTTEPLWVGSRSMAWRLPRVQLHPHDGAPHIRRKMAAAMTGLVLANPDGTGSAYRRVERRARKRRAAGL